MPAPLDETDQKILTERTEARNQRAEVLVGDHIIFADGVRRRVSSTYPDGPQTSAEGSWYLMASGDGEFSGALCPSVPASTLTDTGEVEPARFWFFHHGIMRAHNGVDVEIDVRVWACSQPAN